MELGLSGKTVLVTGASGGIGRAVAERFAGEGAKVVVHYHRNEESANQIVSQLGEPHSIAIGADLSDESQVNSLFEQAVNRFNQIDLLVANAGVWPPDHVPVADMTLEQWQTTINTNLTSVFLSCRSFLRQVETKQIDSPSIVMIGSTAAIFGEAGHGDYSASKSGLGYGLMLTLKNEIAQIAPKGRVNTVSPGWTVTPMAEKFTDSGDSIKKALATIAMRKVAAATDIANAVVFLSSETVAGHITGQMLTVSGGMEGRKLYEDDQLDVLFAVPD